MRKEEYVSGSGECVSTPPSPLAGFIVDAYQRSHRPTGLFLLAPERHKQARPNHAKAKRGVCRYRDRLVRRKLFHSSLPSFLSLLLARFSDSNTHTYTRRLLLPKLEPISSCGESCVSPSLKPGSPEPQIRKWNPPNRGSQLSGGEKAREDLQPRPARRASGNLVY